MKERPEEREKMTIGKNSRKNSVRSSIRAPKFLDKASGFYGRLDEPEATGEEEVMGQEVEERWNGMEDSNREEGITGSLSPDVMQGSGEREEASDYNEGMMEDDGETLLQRKPSRLSSRWRRSSRKKQKKESAEEEAQDEKPSLGTESPATLEDTRVMMEIEIKKMRRAEKKMERAGKGKEPAIVHFAVQEEEDDQVLIRDKKRGRRKEGEEERRIRKEQEEGMKMLKKNAGKNYRKALDRAFRRGWETFIANLYSVTLTPVTSSSPASSSPLAKKKLQHSTVLAEFR